MDIIRINREKLLAVLDANRTTHKAEFEEAHAAWREAATAALQFAAKQAAEGGEVDTAPLRDLPKPISYVKSYDDAITRLEYDTRPEIELADREFSAWVQDDWNWRGQFAGTTSLYNSAG